MTFIPFYHSDIDECVTNQHDCNEKAICSDTDGSFNCTCKVGYRGDGVDCTSTYSVGTVQLHVNCKCYYYSHLMLSYPDVNECAEGIDDCDQNAECSDTEGSYNCTCNHGYSGDGVTCCELIAFKQGCSKQVSNAACN